ncbi:hypothetical protein [Hoeflea sp. IMCC20628]|uniref:hypothetical protein n=1 Tax=Hoeflea sp. IMCC20628 TaxID=1620421 RepID=UPI0012E08C1E|nr:hypothetical protein [Hoeflea sp. IMCC20628]
MVSDVFIQSGERRKINARRHEINNLIIEPGGELYVPVKSRGWLLLNISGNVQIGGTITFRGCIATNGGRSITLPDGSEATFAHPQTALGGYGGDGGIGGFGGAVTGGKGAAGTVNYGGGGGGGAYASHGNPPAAISGDNAVEYRAGRKHSPGGNGGRNNASVHGGMIYIYAPTGNLDGSGGRIDLRGFDGANGINAPQTTGQQGGGGGGAPGGHGGYLIIRTATILVEPELLLEPGKGGHNGLRGGLHRANGTDGYRGDDGEQGLVDYY